MGTPNLKKDINLILPRVINTEDRSKKEIDTSISPIDKTTCHRRFPSWDIESNTPLIMVHSRISLVRGQPIPGDGLEVGQHELVNP